MAHDTFFGVKFTKELKNPTPSNYHFIITMGKKIEDSFIALTEEILHLPDLNYFDKILLAKIHSLDNSKRNCYANNSYFAKLLGCSKTYVSKSISKLKKRGHIFIFINRRIGNKRQIKSLLKNMTRSEDTGVQSPIKQSFNHIKEIKKKKKRRE